jgi:hypothetical protein
MNAIHEAARSVPVVHECDVCVVGGSCAGVFAAVAAARLGCKAAVVEALGCFGGNATAGLVCVWHTPFDTVFKKDIVAGLPLELIARLKRRGVVEDKGPGPHLQYIFQPSEMAIELDELITEAGVRPFLHTRFVSPVMDGDRLDAIIIEDQTGRRAIRARFFVDASGDGVLADRAGAPTYRAPHLQPPTACALFQGLDAVRAGTPDFQLGNVIYDAARYPEAIAPGFCWSAKLAGQPGIEMVAGTRVHNADCSDADQLTRAEIEGRRQVRAISDLLRRHFPGGDQVALVSLPATIGIRQTRQIRCLYQLTEMDVLEGVRFDDAIANGSYRVDVHSATDGGITFRYLDGRENVVYQDRRAIEERRWRPVRPVDPTFYQIPYRSLVPRDVVNLVCAGRCLDADVGAFGAVRVMINTTQMGEAAGTAAFVALDTNVAAPKVSPATLRQTLAQQGAIVL